MLKEYRFSAARQEFTSVFDDVQRFIPSLIKARKKSESDGVLLNRNMLADILNKYTFEVDMKLEDDGYYWSIVRPFNNGADFGETAELCRKKTAESALEFAEQLLETPSMFEAENMRPLVPYCLRLLLCDSLEEVENILFETERAKI